MASLFDEELERQRQQLEGVGVTPEMVADAPNVAEAQSLLPVPLSPIEKMIERDGKAKTFGKMLLGGFTGMTPLLMPELIGGNARYKAELDIYNDQLKRQQASQLADPHRAALANNDTSDDFAAIEQLSMLYPDIYGPVLRDKLQRQHNPTEETMFAPDYQLDPETGEWVMVQTGNRGTTTKTGMGPGFIPESRMWSPDAREKAIGEADDRIQQSNEHIYDLRTLGEDLDSVKDEWTAGMQGKLGEEWKELRGAQDKVTAVRTQYRRIRNALAVQDLPPGVASDKDIAMVLEGFPSDFSNYETLREYVAAMERAERKIRAYHKFESSYLSDKGTRTGMAAAWDKEQKSVFDSAVGEQRTWSFADEE